MLRWQQAEGKRHALNAKLAPRPGDSFRALCGEEVFVEREDVVALGGQWLAGTCWNCDAVWRKRENIPQFTS
jgi:hypothetical protein